MTIKYLTKNDVLAACIGGSVYASGGGGFYEHGLEMGEAAVALSPVVLKTIDEFEEDVFLRNVLGDHIFYKYLEAKKEEWNVFRSQVTDWEIGEYLYKY